jgi:hypothetical protein
MSPSKLKNRLAICRLVIRRIYVLPQNRGLAQWEQFGKRRNKEEERKNERKDLTLTGLLMEDLAACGESQNFAFVT